MKRIFVALAAVVALAATVIAPAQAKFTGLKGEVNDNFQIKLTRNGVRVKTIKAGRYQVQIEDESSAHNFRLRGPGINRSTGVGFVGKRMWTVTLKKGRYTIQCDPHKDSGMRSTFRAT